MTLSIVKTQIDFPKTARHNPFQTLQVWNRFSVVFSRRLGATSWILCPQIGGIKMKEFVRSLWNDQEGQDIAEYAVMLAVILVIVVGTIRLVGANANNVFSSVASTVN
jgi:Flp pilus assembly pilin Flp